MEGLLGSIFTLLELELKALDHTTLSRRSGGLQVERIGCRGPSLYT